MNPSSHPFLEQLRTATGPQHHALESLTVSKSLMNPAITLKDYAHYLGCMQGVMQFYDNDILPRLEKFLPGISDRTKSNALSSDLAFCNSAGTASSAVADFSPTVPNDDPAFLFGMAYVIEGSTLGGRMIIKHVSQKLDITEEKGGTFFGGYGERTGMMWKDFLAAMTQYVVTEKKEETCIAGAVHGFNMIHAHFQNCENA